MKKQVLNIEQMKHLQSLGVDTNKASMYWVFSIAPHYRTKLYITGELGCLKTFDDRDLGIGAFTLQDILNILPTTIGGRSLRINATQNWIEYADVIGGCLAHNGFFEKGESVLEAAYKMLCYLKIEGKI
jgi:hypothetical protein